MKRWMTDPILTVEHLTMRFGGLVAIDGLSFDVGRRDITAIIGPNGAGKTTVFNCITGFYKPTEGRIAIALTPESRNRLEEVTATGRRGTPDRSLFLLERMPDFEVAQRAKVARTFQNIRLFGGMTVLENLMVAQHNNLMNASGYSVRGLLGLPSLSRRHRRGRGARQILARARRANRSRRRSRRRSSLRCPAPTGDRARNVFRTEAAVPR